ncbi:DUF11 domain-containing protein [Deinococcus koreensis]|uniref:DUF11 domain-containing protein n=1 Tax=Deinococcus koreensis TaxID=2054903 RepID=A0A2K3V2F8_9DEIO|nr:DUF11 domain-containing protein [Deinococcus koreensis]PNY82980.1 DUF11 domain-containing protein [Deinococcus koreensis]
MKRMTTALTALLAVGAWAQAQQVSSDLPITSVGQELLWSVGDQELNLEVPLAGRVRLELYSPRFDPDDYRSAASYGDERYVPGQTVTTTFTLRAADGQVLLTRSYSSGAQDWDTLLDQELPAGRYRLTAVTQGYAKNTFAVRLAGVSAVLSADTLSVNIHSREWVPALQISSDGSAHALRMYDGDGPLELEARLRDGQGRLYPLQVSADLDQIDLPLPARAGQYTLELRQPAGAVQFSNTVGFRLTHAGQITPITLSRVDQTGLLRVAAELLLPGGAQPTGADVLAGPVPLHVDGQLAQRVPAGRYALTAAPVAGAEVTVTPAVEVPQGGRAEARVQVRPQLALTLQADRQEVCLGDAVTLSLRADTAFAGELPFALRLLAPGLSLDGPDAAQGSLKAGQPGELRVTGTARQAGPLTIRAELGPWGQSQTLNLSVRPDTTSLRLERAPVPAARVGDETTVAVSVTNTAAQPVPFVLRDVPGAGLQALESPELSGTLAPGERRTLSYRARVLQAGSLQMEAALVSEGCAATQTARAEVLATAQEALPVPQPPVEPAPAAPAPAQRRLSTVSLPFDAPGQARELVVAQTLPEGALLQPGSSRLDGRPIPDPLRGPSGRWYWTLPQPALQAKSTIRGVISYDLLHTAALGELSAPALLARFGGERSEVLEGRVDASDLASATPLLAEGRTENAGAIKQPLAGSLIRVRDRISVVVEQPQGQSSPLSVNGQPVGEEQVGELTEDGVRGLTRRVYVGVPLRPGPNTLQVGADTVSVNLAGATSQIRVTPEQLVADGSTPLRLRVRTLDAFGNSSAQNVLTLRSSLEIRSPDAQPAESGQQLRLQDGEGVLELQPQGSPTTLRLDILNGARVETHTFEVRPSAARVGVGVISATLGLDGSLGADDLSVQARASYEGPLAGGKLYVAADKDGLPTDRDTLRRFAAAGDSSAEDVPLQGIDPVALTYDHPSFRADYRRAALPIEVLPVGEQLTALSVRSKASAQRPGTQVSGFAALVPESQITGLRLRPEGTRLLRLPSGGIEDGSESLTLLTLEAGTGKELRQTMLVRNVDYLLDGRTGIITLARALERVDADLHDQVVVASYRLSSSLAGRRLAFGAQVKHSGGQYSVGAAVVSLDDTVTYGARAAYDDGSLRADGLLAYSGGLQASADFGARFGEAASVSARVRYQDAAYHGLAPFTPGLNFGAESTVRLNSRLSAVAQAEYHDTGSGQAHVQGGSVSARAEYRAAPFTAGAGLKYAFGEQSGLGAVVSAGYHKKPLDIDVVHTQPLGGTLDPTTSVSAKYALDEHLSLGLSDQINWRTGQTAALTLESQLGDTNYALAYDLPGSGGQGNRARFGVSTSLPLGERLNAGLRGSASYDLKAAQAEFGAGVDLRYKTDRLTATSGTDLTLNDRGFGVVLRGGVSGALSDQLTLSADGLLEFGAGKQGARAALGYAYRGRTLSSLGTVRYAAGSLGGSQPELSSNFAAEYRQANWAVRAGLDTRTLLNDPGSFTLQAAVGGTYYVTDYFGIGAWGRMISQPSTRRSQAGLGLEASLRALPGAWITAGYNPLGFSGLGNTYTKQGAYLRLDLTLDEQGSK